MQRTFLFYVMLPLLFVAIVVACESKQEKARGNLKKLNVQYTPGLFVESAKNGDIVVVGSFLEAGMNPDVKNDAGCSAMFYAVMQKNEKMISLLKEHGAKEVNLDRILGSWVLCAIPDGVPIKISKEGDQYIYWGLNPYNLDDDKPYPTKANLVNENTLVFSIPWTSVVGTELIHTTKDIEVKLGEDDILNVSGISFKRISK
jgi:hypothetical protein